MLTASAPAGSPIHRSDPLQPPAHENHLSAEGRNQNAIFSSPPLICCPPHQKAWRSVDHNKDGTIPVNHGEIIQVLTARSLLHQNALWLSLWRSLSPRNTTWPRPLTADSPLCCRDQFISPAVTKLFKRHYNILHERLDHDNKPAQHVPLTRASDATFAVSERAAFPGPPLPHPLRSPLCSLCLRHISHLFCPTIRGDERVRRDRR